MLRVLLLREADLRASMSDGSRMDRLERVYREANVRLVSDILHTQTSLTLWQMGGRDGARGS